MDAARLEQAVELLEQVNADLDPDLVDAELARQLLAAYARAGKLAAYGVAALARKLDSTSEIARVTGTSMGRANEVVATAKVLEEGGVLTSAFEHGEISLEQAAAIAAAEGARLGAAAELLAVAQKEPFHVLKDRARRVKLEAEQHRDLASRQHRARSARSYADELGMTHIHVALEPHIGTPIVARAEADAARLARSSRAEGAKEPFEAHLADAYAALLSGIDKGPARRPELVLLVSHEVVKRGWKDVRKGEHCKIPGVGPVAPEVARALAKDAFLSGVFYDGKDLRHFKRWGRHIPIEVLIALELGEPPSFDGIACSDCGNRFRTEFDHVRPRFAHGPTSKPNLQPRCWRCHRAKTKRDRKTSMMKPPEP